MTNAQQSIFNRLDARCKNLQSDNYADYTTIRGAICCGWMDLHDDDAEGSETFPIFTILPLWWNQDVAILHQNDQNQWCMDIPSGQPISFNASRLHALVPKHLAEEAVRSQSIDFQTMEQWDENVFNGDPPDHNIQLVWTWYNPQTNKCFLDKRTQYNSFESLQKTLEGYV